MDDDFTCLRFDYELVHGQPVRSVVGEPAEGCGYWRIGIVTDNGTILISVDEDTDQVWVSLTAKELTTEDWKPVPFLQDWLGLELGWSWVGINSQGYKDTFILSCAGVDPQWAFVGEGSSLTCYRMTQTREPLGSHRDE
ncbi:hypothetical protein H9L12_00990 [Sphingomonas rhizophila]|uniref:Uncharacterized protein n=1 Tax=Sphingomonas rhizophila TaxID=2071607 RepID=A0A7G9SBN2_9SPHN|nr:DUF6334 family protein [Sphingomonas rhizophila]QNN65257.1 hypothetical protein H9L12_00990 [Sphingomonas rhizophila]